MPCLIFKVRFTSNSHVDFIGILVIFVHLIDTENMICRNSRNIFEDRSSRHVVPLGNATNFVDNCSLHASFPSEPQSTTAVTSRVEKLLF